MPILLVKRVLGESNMSFLRCSLLLQPDTVWSYPQSALGAVGCSVLMDSLYTLTSEHLQLIRGHLSFRTIVFQAPPTLFLQEPVNLLSGLNPACYVRVSGAAMTFLGQ